MDNAFFYRARRTSELLLSNGEKKLRLGEGQYIHAKRLIFESVDRFIKDFFNFSSLEVEHGLRKRGNKQSVAYPPGELISHKGYSNYYFILEDGEDIHDILIRNIPALPNNEHIAIFFNTIRDHVSTIWRIMSKTVKVDTKGGKVVSPELMFISEQAFCNMPKTIILEYLFNVFNNHTPAYANPREALPLPMVYGIDLLNTIYDFSCQLSTIKIESRELYCGFIFHAERDYVHSNSVLNIELESPIPFGNFSLIKNYLTISNGQNIFFNVTDGIITHLLITKEKPEELYFSPLPRSKNFHKRPLLVSIQGIGKVIFLEGREGNGEDKNKLLLQLNNAKPIIRDIPFIKKRVAELLNTIIPKRNRSRIDSFVNWMLSLSTKNKGTSLIIGDFDHSISSAYIKGLTIKYPSREYLEGMKKYDFELLDHFTKPDGGIVLNKSLIPVSVGTILPNKKLTKGSDGGARHNSIQNFTKQKDCLGIVVSEDGPITIYQNGIKLLRF